MNNIINKFQVKGNVVSCESYGNGHINDTYLLICQEENGNINKYILQKLNTNIFPNFSGLMDNVSLVTRFLKEKITLDGGDPERECMTLVDTIDNHHFYSQGTDCWRCYIYIDNTVAYQIVETPAMFEDTGKTFGNFIALLNEFDATTLCEVIPNFHNTVDRLEKFNSALSENLSNRKNLACQEIEFVQSHKYLCNKIVDALKDNSIPLRVTHNDTKLNNILIDADTQKALCVIDLDTIMPGSLLYDFGDSIRFGCNTGEEDEKDLSKVDFSLTLYDAYCRGFLQGIGSNITEKEVSMLHLGSMIMTFECGMRFLTDFLNGDTYFKTAYPEHNLVRCRTQFKLVECMLANSDKMIAIANKYYKK